MAEARVTRVERLGLEEVSRYRHRGVRHWKGAWVRIQAIGASGARDIPSGKHPTRSGIRGDVHRSSHRLRTARRA